MGEYFFSIFPNENFLDLRLYQYGWEQCAPLHSFGPSVRNHYLFHYVVSGQGFLNVNDEDTSTRHYDLGPGQGFLICPGKVNTYSAHGENPWKYIWLEFDGLRAGDCLNRAGLSHLQPIFQPESSALGDAIRDRMLYITDHPDASPLHLIGQLFLFLDQLIEASSTRRTAQGVNLRDFYIEEAVTYMRHHYQRETLTVEEIAEACKLGRSYFSKIFKESMGCPPQEFLIRLRLSRATELMKLSGDSIGDISAACGYPNQLHFSRAFKKRYGLSPRQWRDQNKYRGE